MKGELGDFKHPSLKQLQSSSELILSLYIRICALWGAGSQEGKT